MSVKLTEDHLAAIRAHGERTFPEECGGLLLGVVPTLAGGGGSTDRGSDRDRADRRGSDQRMSDPSGMLEPIRVLWRRLGFDPDRLPGTVVVTPQCGLAGASPAHARAAR